MSVQQWLPSLWSRESGKPVAFDSLRDEIDRAFNTFTRTFPAMSPGGDFLPAMNVQETEKEVVVSLELAGMTREDVELSVLDQRLTVSGEKKTSEEKKEGEFLRMEQRYGSFSRTIALPFRIDAEKVDAKFENGLLKVTIQKPDDYKAKAQKVDIKG